MGFRPEGFIATGIGTTEVKCSTLPLGLEIEAEAESVGGWHRVQYTQKPDGTCIVSGLTPGTKYHFRARYQTGGQVSEWSKIDSGTTDGSATPPVETPGEPVEEHVSLSSPVEKYDFPKHDLKPHREKLPPLIPRYKRIAVIDSWSQLARLQSDTDYVLTRDMEAVTPCKIDGVENVRIRSQNLNKPVKVLYDGKPSNGGGVFQASNNAARILLEAIAVGTTTRFGSAFELNGTDQQVLGCHDYTPGKKFGPNDPYFIHVVKFENDAHRCAAWRIRQAVSSRYLCFLDEGASCVDIGWCYCEDANMEHIVRSIGGEDVLIYENDFSNVPNTTAEEKYRAILNLKRRRKFSIFRNRFDRRGGNITIGPLQDSDGNPEDPKERMSEVWMFENVLGSHAGMLLTLAAGLSDCHVKGNLFTSAKGRFINIDAKGEHLEKQGPPEAEIDANSFAGPKGAEIFDQKKWPSVKFGAKNQYLAV